MDETIVNVTTAKFNAFITLVQQYGAAFAVKILRYRLLDHRALADRLCRRHGAAGLGQAKLDPTVLRYVGSVITVTLNIIW